MSMKYTPIVKVLKETPKKVCGGGGFSIEIFFLIFVQNIDCATRKNSIAKAFLTSTQNIDCGTRKNRIAKAVLTSTHNLCFWRKHKKDTYTPVNPTFTIKKWSTVGYSLHGHDFEMHVIQYLDRMIII